MGTEDFRYKRRLRQGDLVIIPSPFTDQSGKKLRPGIVISNERYNRVLQDFICVPLSTELRNYEHVFRLYLDDIGSGFIHKQSDVRVDKIISMNQKLIIKRVGRVKFYIVDKIKNILNKLIE